MAQQLPADVGQPLPPAPARNLTLVVGAVVMTFFVLGCLTAALLVEGWFALVPLAMAASAGVTAWRAMEGGRRTYLSATRVTRTQLGRLVDTIAFADVTSFGFDDSLASVDRESAIVVRSGPPGVGDEITVAEGPHTQLWPLVQRLDQLLQEKPWLLADGDRKAWTIIAERAHRQAREATVRPLAEPSATQEAEPWRRTEPWLPPAPPADPAPTPEQAAVQPPPPPLSPPEAWDGRPWDGTPRL